MWSVDKLQDTLWKSAGSPIQCGKVQPSSHKSTSCKYLNNLACGEFMEMYFFFTRCNHGPWSVWRNIPAKEFSRTSKYFLAEKLSRETFSTFLRPPWNQGWCTSRKSPRISLITPDKLFGLITPLCKNSFGWEAFLRSPTTSTKSGIKVGALRGSHQGLAAGKNWFRPANKNV